MKPQWTAITASRPQLLSVPRRAARNARIQRRGIASIQQNFSACAASSNRGFLSNGSRQASTICLGLTNSPPRHALTQYRNFSTTKAPLDPAMDQHKQRVEKISSRVRDYHSRGEKFRIFHGSTNSTRPGIKKNLVDTSTLSHVLHVDVEKKACLVEPNVSMDRLVEETLKYGLVPPVVMEFPGITVGGGYSGTSGESSSFRHGFFDQTINWVEMVLADGEVVRLSSEKRSDLLHGAAGAVGTFGVITLVELRLQDAKKYVETTYHPVTSMQEAISKLKHFTREDSLYEYVDGIMFSKTHGAIITGLLTDVPKPGAPMQNFSSARDPWFYLHVRDALNQSFSATTETIPLPEYLFRYDRGGFWVGASAFEYFKFPFNKFTRWFLDDFLHTRMMYTALHASGQSKKYVVQDLALPYSTAEAFVNYTDEEFRIYPLWLCPLKQSPIPTMHPHFTPSASVPADPDAVPGEPEPMLNIGLWGPGPEDHDEFIRKNRSLEAKLKELGGMKWLYAHTYYSEDEFWTQFDRPWYEAVRAKYKAQGLPSVYEKVKVDVKSGKGRLVEKGKTLRERMRTMWPFAGFYGIKMAIKSKTYLAARKSAWKQYREVEEVDR
ncbi:related to 24-dehydrocholesterol reductase precursor [Rhynchosporium agropyri]|uniref:Delta(24)-sterol reductase n=1 Tax=Rhynchosporium agropyri TaxID=914238 RepID=A0A1E1JYA5_9HELO|nr:related to 24-dehydrocholesterol reductase precursor [Rhynchosporium agropyri]